MAEATATPESTPAAEQYQGDAHYDHGLAKEQAYRTSLKVESADATVIASSAEAIVSALRGLTWAVLSVREEMKRARIADRYSADR